MPWEFVALTVIGNLPVTFGVPDSTPALDKVTPEGRDPVLCEGWSGVPRSFHGEGAVLAFDEGRRVDRGDRRSLDYPQREALGNRITESIGSREGDRVTPALRRSAREHTPYELHPPGQPPRLRDRRSWLALCCDGKGPEGTSKVPDPDHPLDMEKERVIVTPTGNIHK